MLHPVVVLAVLILTANDQVAKALWPGIITGKLSDLAGLVVFPLLLVSLDELCRAILRKGEIPSRRTLIAAIAITGIGFSAAKVIPLVGDWYRVLWGYLAAPLRGSTGPVVLSQDPTDLLALPALAVGWLIGSQRLDLARREGVEPPTY
jgi:hypothetical protein